MKLPRRHFLHLAAGTAALSAVSDIAKAQAYPGLRTQNFEIQNKKPHAPKRSKSFSHRDLGGRAAMHIEMASTAGLVRLETEP
jgi:hypothetical protein